MPNQEHQFVRTCRSQIAITAIVLCAALNVANLANAQTQTVVPHTQTVETVDRVREYTVKSVYLYNFARMIEWPEVPGIPTDQFRIGVYGTSDISKPLTELSTRRTVLNRRTRAAQTIAITPFQTVKDTTACQILFVPRTTPGDEVRQLIQKFENQPVMLVGEKQGFAAMGGTADFLLQGQGIQFNLNLETIQSKALKPSAKLLTAAHEILHTQKPTPGLAPSP